MYQATKTMWRNCIEHIDEMVLFKALYTEEYCLERIAEIEAAEAMKDMAARALLHESIRLELVTLAGDCRDNWQALKQYISTAFKTKEARENNWRGAGWAHYAGAGDDNWISVQALMNAGKLYIAENTATLSANQNMPATFPTTFNASILAFNTKLAEFTNAQETAGVGTDAKNEANNDVYTLAIDMGQDGQFVFRKSESLRKQFSFEAVTEKLEPAGSSTVVVEAKDAETNAPIPVFDVTNLETNRTVTSAEGRAEMGQQSAGTGKQYRVVADGYPETILTVNVNTGTKVIERVSLTPILSMAARAEIAETANATPTPSPELVTVK
jgi:hypothetical protein